MKFNLGMADRKQVAPASEAETIAPVPPSQISEQWLRSNGNPAKASRNPQLESDDPVSAIASCADAHNEMRHFPLSAAEKTSSLPVFLPSHSWKSRQRASNRSGNAASVRVISHSSYPITRARRQDIVHGRLPFRGNGKGKPLCVFSGRNR